MKKSRFALSLILLVTIFLAGCASPEKSAAAKAADDEYVTIPPKTGSNMPRRVKKSDLLAGKIPDADTSSIVGVDPETFARSVGHPVRQGN